MAMKDLKKPITVPASDVRSRYYEAHRRTHGIGGREHPAEDPEAIIITNQLSKPSVLLPLGVVEDLVRLGRAAGATGAAIDGLAGAMEDLAALFPDDWPAEED
jgi:hypothetical protein